MSVIKNKFEDLKIPLEDIVSATNSFSDANYLGRGGFGSVYKGEFINSIQKTSFLAAVKRLDRGSHQGNTEFWKEVTMLSDYKHENIVRLFGFCDEWGERILVYEFASRLSLDRYIASADLNWIQRLNICLGAARGLQYLHHPNGTLQKILHRDIKSSNILLDETWTPKISDFGLSRLGSANQPISFIATGAVGTPGYCDPQYAVEGILTKESDVYSFGVVLFEVLCGRLCFTGSNGEFRSFVDLARYSFENNKLHEIVYDGIKLQIKLDSLKKFAAIAYQCLKKACEDRPTMIEVVDELKITLGYQISPSRKSLIMEGFEDLKIPFGDIESATNSFGDGNIIGRGGFGYVYKGELRQSDRNTTRTVAVKRLDGRMGQGDPEFWREIMMLSNYKHENIISLLGFCDEKGEKILVYEFAPQKSLDLYLGSANLDWIQRLKISLGAARGLSYLHHPDGRHERIIHRDIKSSNILLDENWKPKISDFGLSRLANQQFLFIATGIVGSIGYCDPLYAETGILTNESDVYSFGVVLFEVLCGRLCITRSNGEFQSFVDLVRYSFENNKLNEIVYDGIKYEINPNSLKAFATVAFRCLKKACEDRPTMIEVVNELESAIGLQLCLPISPSRKSLHIEGFSRKGLIIKEFEHLRIPLEVIKSATNGFGDDKILGKGGFGKVYKGELHQSDRNTIRTVAVKRLDRQGFQGDPEFWKEIMMLSNSKHENIISLLGFCNENDEKILVYEFAPKKSLDFYLGSHDLDWIQRLKICLGAARGLSYLHHPNDRPESIIHRDIKSSNILLDENWKPKISDFYLSKLANQQFSVIVSNPVGTFGYCDPLYVETGCLTKDSDVYSFGIVLFEVLCGRLCLTPSNGERHSFAEVARHHVEQNKLNEMIFSLINFEINPDSLKAYATIAYKCLKSDRKERPTMTQIVFELENALELQLDAVKCYDLGKLQFGCKHYRSRCKLRAPCCNRIFPCCRCHDEYTNELRNPDERHKMVSRDVNQVVCNICRTEQPATQICVNCGVKMGEYFCRICKLYDDDTSKGKFHCDDCGICRLEGRENFFHCHDCRDCYHVSGRQSHTCSQNNLRKD